MTIAAAVWKSRTLSVNSTSLLSLYLVMPILVLFVGWDTLFWNHQWRDRILPQFPAEILIWSIVFNFPHIVSSLVTLADKAYWDFYRRRLIVGFSVIAASVLVINLLTPVLFGKQVTDLIFLVYFVFYAGYTVWHVLSQQFGIGLMLMRVTPQVRYYSMWRWLSTTAGTLMYVMVFGEVFFNDVQLFGVDVERLLMVVALGFVVLASLVGAPLVIQSRRTLGSWYGVGNLAILPVSYLMLLWGYPVFVVMIPRFIHDFTAFQVYAVHDHNRNREVAHNLVYRCLRWVPLTPLMLCPLVAIVLANSVECSTMWIDTLIGSSATLPQKCLLEPAMALPLADRVPGSMALWLQVFFITGFFHYFIEGFVWKRESIHRHSVGFS